MNELHCVKKILRPVDVYSFEIKSMYRFMKRYVWYTQIYRNLKTNLNILFLKKNLNFDAKCCSFTELYDKVIMLVLCDVQYYIFLNYFFIFDMDMAIC